MSTVADRVYSEGVAVAYERYDREESAMWEELMRFPTPLAGRRYIEGEHAARRDLQSRLDAEPYYAREAA